MSTAAFGLGVLVTALAGVVAVLSSGRRGRGVVHRSRRGRADRAVRRTRPEVAAHTIRTPATPGLHNSLLC
jgi:hypothetical protein